MLSDYALMDIAGIIGESGTCTRLQVGAILTQDRRIISTGYNGAPSGILHCYHQEGDERPCEATVHAEANTIAFAAKNGVNTEGSVLYTTHSPCVTCARLLVNAGVKEVIFQHEYRDARGLGELAAGGVKVTAFNGSEVRIVPNPPRDGSDLYPSEPPIPRPESEGDADPHFDYRRGTGI